MIFSLGHHSPVVTPSLWLKLTSSFAGSSLTPMHKPSKVHSSHPREHQLEEDPARATKSKTPACSSKGPDVVGLILEKAHLPRPLPSPAIASGNSKFVAQACPASHSCKCLHYKMAWPRDDKVTQQLAQTNVWLPFFLVQSSYIKLLICELFGLDPDELGLGCHDQEDPRFKQVHRTTLVGLGERQLLQGAVGTQASMAFTTKWQDQGIMKLPSNWLKPMFGCHSFWFKVPI